jgi:serpin B
MGKRFRVMVGLAALLAVISGGGAALADGKAKVPEAPPSEGFRPAVATGAFGLDLLRAAEPGNVVLSPDSVAAALAMTGTGARGQTADEIARTLRLKGPSAFSSVGDLQLAITAGQAAAARSDPDAPTLDIANGLFLQQGFPFDPAFLGGTQDHFGATPETVDFANDPRGALDAINGWVSDHTGGLIPQILDELPPKMVLALANAVYLDADWEHPFEKRETRPGTFHGSQGGASVEFMHQTADFGYSATRGYKAVDLPYRSSNLSLLAVLPRGQKLGSLQHHLDGRALSRISASLDPVPVELSFPRFHLKTDTELSAPLSRLGMPTAFGESANFSGITTAAALKIGFVKHDADFALDEEGTIAAAATVVGVEATSAPGNPPDAVSFTANRPFLFFLRDDKTGATLFAGRLVDPASAAP